MNVERQTDLWLVIIVQLIVPLFVYTRSNSNLITSFIVHRISLHSIHSLHCKLPRGFDNSVVDSCFPRRFIHKRFVLANYALSYVQSHIHAHAHVARARHFRLLIEKVSTCFPRQRTEDESVVRTKNVCVCTSTIWWLKCTRYCLSILKVSDGKLFLHGSGQCSKIADALRFSPEYILYGWHNKAKMCVINMICKRVKYK